MSSGGHPAVIHETTVCCKRFQFREKPMKRGVFSGTCGFGGRFHGGIGGRSSAEWAAAARGKLSTIGMAGGRSVL